MKLITQGSANTVVFTLNEKCTLPNPVFLFRFVSKIQGTENTCLASDVSSYKYRYNEFVITESTTQDRVNGTLTLAPTGEWEYYVYEQSSATNLDFAVAGALMETGIVRVIGTDTTYSRHTKSTTNKVYGTGA